MSDEPSGFPPDVKGQRAWAKTLLRQSCDTLDRIKAGEKVSRAEKLTAHRSIQFAISRARELGFKPELEVLALARGLCILDMPDD